MARAEHEDTIRVDTLGECIVVQRYQTYFGPKLRIEPDDEDTQYLLTAPGPKSELNLWENVGGEWDVQAEVSAELMEMKQYEICQYCGEPLKTADHRRRRAVGACGT
jgi:ribosomal protein S27AE